MAKNVGTRGKRLYRCLECGRGTFFSHREENRAGRLRCSACGSARLEVSKMGGDRRADSDDQRRVVADRLDANGTGSVVLE